VALALQRCVGCLFVTFSIFLLLLALNAVLLLPEGEGEGLDARVIEHDPEAPVRHRGWLADDLVKLLGRRTVVIK
jgi:hypothetical protein